MLPETVWETLLGLRVRGCNQRRHYVANGSPFSLLGDLNFFNQMGVLSFFSIFCSQKLEKGYHYIWVCLFWFFLQPWLDDLFLLHQILQIVSSSSLMQFERGTAVVWRRGCLCLRTIRGPSESFLPFWWGAGFSSKRQEGQMHFASGGSPAG